MQSHETPPPEASGHPCGSGFWDHLCQESDTDALIATWGMPPLWSAPVHYDDEREDQK